MLPAVLFLSLSGCFGPSYPKERVAELVQEICRKEYKRDVTAKLVGKTLYARHVIDDLVGTDLELQPKKLDALDDLLRVTNRVSQSTDATIEFIVLQLEDRRLATRLDLLQRFEDYKSLRNTRISQEDFQSRLVFEWAKGGSEETSERDFTLPDFMARLTASRLERNLTGNPLVNVLLEVQSIEGRVEDGVLILAVDQDEREPAETLSVGVLENAVSETVLDVAKKYDPSHVLVQSVRIENAKGKVRWTKSLAELAPVTERSQDALPEEPKPGLKSNVKTRQPSRF